MKDDEARFLKDVYSAVEKKPRDIINQDGFYMHHKRAWGILEKWCNKGWYDYGVSVDLGWLTEEGKAEALKISTIHR